MRSAFRFAGMILVLTVLAPAPMHAGIIEEIVANVNGDIITKTDVEAREKEVEATLFQNLSGSELDRAVTEMRKSLLVDMINERLLFQRAERMGLDLEQVYESSLENIKAQNNIQTNEEFYTLLKQQGMSREEFRENLLKYNVPDIMINIEVRQKIAISPDEAVAFYDENPDRFTHPTTYSFREIAILLDIHSREEAMGMAEEIAAKSASGADFEDLVEEYSESMSADQGGLVESLPAPEMSPQILEGLAPLVVGEVSNPVETSRAVFVLQLVERDESHRDDMDAVLPQIEAALKREKYQEELEKYLAGLWENNWICVFPKYTGKFSTDRYGETTTCS